MPLVRYEVRCEHSLANPELYRTTDRDDSEALLEGVAMAGLVGLVRQLGDLAEFAAEIFHDLHDDIVKMVSRGQTLKTRVTRLEEDLPVVEKALLAKASQFRFAYTARSKWRAPLPMDQNVCGQGELPRFVRNFYDDCRGPPRLFLLDKFDGDGRGACVKRYTDPTFFRLTWATSQLEKAEQAERERQEQLELLAQQQQQQKKSSVKRGSNNNAGPVYPRERLSSAHFENLEGFSGDFTPELRSMRLDRVAEGGDLTPDDEPQSPVLPEVDQGPVLAPLKISAKDIENAKWGRRMPTPTSDDDDEGVSEYVDALTTVGSDVDSEHSRWSARLSVDSEHNSHHRESFAQRPIAGAVEWERSESIATVESRDPSVEKEEQLALVNVEQQPVTTPRSRRQWARDNGSQAETSSIILSFVDNEGGDLASRLRARLLESTGASSSSRALVPHQQEEEEMEFPERSSVSSNTSSPYTNLSSSSAVEDGDGFTSESASSSPKGGPSFCTLLSPPESPPRRSPALNSPRAPPITPFLSSSPSVSRSSSIKHDPSGAQKVPQNCLSPHLIEPPSLRQSSLSPQTSDFPVPESSEKIKDILVTDPRRTSENGGLELDPNRSQDQTSTRPRMWVDRSESNVAATLRAIRQAAAVGSDDDTGSECRSECAGVPDLQNS